MPRTRCRWRDCDPDKNEKQYTGCRYFLWHVMSSAATEVKLINPQLAIKSCRSGCGEKMSVGSLTQAMWAVVCAPGASRSLVVLSSRCRDFTLAPFDRIVTFGLAVNSLRICSTPVDHQLQYNVFCYATVWGPICFIVSHAWEICLLACGHSETQTILYFFSRHRRVMKCKNSTIIFLLVVYWNRI